MHLGMWQVVNGSKKAGSRYPLEIMLPNDTRRRSSCFYGNDLPLGGLPKNPGCLV